MNFDLRLLFAGIGILLYGMHNFEQALNFLGGKKLKHLLQKYTTNRRSAIFTGARTTTLMQSSSLTSLLVLAFAGAGIISLANAVGVVFGANIGSPILPLLAALLGFGDFKISTIALPLIAVGGCMLIFTKNDKRLRIAKLMVGFGLLFIGLDRMKESVTTLKASFDLTTYATMSLRGFGLIGIIATFVIQSSGALNIMALAALDAGIISFPASIALALGANIGTTGTALIGSFGGKRIKRQIALSHVLFNVLGAMIGVLFFWQLIRLVNHGLGLKDHPVIASGVRNVLYNLCIALLFGSILPYFLQLIKRLLPDHEDAHILHIDSLNHTIPLRESYISPYLAALTEDMKMLIEGTLQYTEYIYGLKPKLLETKDLTEEIAGTHLLKRNKATHIDQYEVVKTMADKLFAAVLQLKGMKKNQESVQQLRHIDKTIASCLKAVKATKNIRRDLLDLRESDETVFKQLYEKLLATQVSFYRYLYRSMGEYDMSKFESLSQALLLMKHFQQESRQLISTLSKQGKFEDMHLTTLINLDHYVYETADMLMIAIAYTYLEKQDLEAFEKISDVPDQVYEDFDLSLEDTTTDS